ncbi:putative ankyrin repeat protein [Megavirus courdo7]|uniref:Putative ankyrin repeat protein n=1 Tax=Megavirus courdo7 TaxID=1128135 RepID=H2EAT5_9VIRU|nr:putative ankyrin repeat protein [Megavirus courdo7]
MYVTIGYDDQFTYKKVDDYTIVTSGMDMTFSKIENIDLLYNNGTTLLLVDTIDDKNIFKRKKGYAKKLILRKSYDLFDYNTYQELDLDITKNKHIVDLASINCNIDFLNWWINNNIMLEYSVISINQACFNGDIEILNWWLTSGLTLKYDNEAIDNGNIEILNWWIESGLELKYSNKSIDNASYNGDIEILNWWVDSGLKLKYMDILKY